VRRVILAGLLTIVVGWNAALVAAPVVDAPRFAAVTYLAGSLICHQQPERSFHLNGAQYPVCARCLGLYLGAVLGVIGWAALAGLRDVPHPRATALLAGNRVRRVLLWMAVPSLATLVLAWSGVWDPNNLLRAVVALPLGAAIAATVAAVAAGDLR
jgi:uncharacterized membrane protein